MALETLIFEIARNSNLIRQKGRSSRGDLRSAIIFQTLALFAPTFNLLPDDLVVPCARFEKLPLNASKQKVELTHALAVMSQVE